MPGLSSTDLELWQQATEFDRSLRLSPRLFERLARKRVHSELFSRDTRFRRMAAGRIALFTGLRVLGSNQADGDPSMLLTNALRTAFSDTERLSVVTGKAAIRRNLPVTALLDRWERRRAVVSVTDLHIRGSRLEEVIDTEVLSDFNILCRGSEDLAWHEMMTMVVSSKGNVTDSHSDDPDGSNHCFQGRKLWLVWETFEGRANGLQDVERDYVTDRARFDMRTFLRLRTSRWFVVSPGMTLFLPGDLTHKVVTLEHYLGVGSFYLSVPNCVRTISRWRLHGPLWTERERKSNTPALVGEMARTATRLIRQVREMDDATQQRWGMPFLGESIRHWKRAVPAGTRMKLLREPDFKALVGEALGRA